MFAHNSALIIILAFSFKEDTCMSMTGGFGARYLSFSFRRPDGTHDATKWFTLLYMPVIPLRRDKLVIGETRAEYFRGGVVRTTEYRIVCQTPLRAMEILATYLTWWVLVPGAAITPLVLFSKSGWKVMGSDLLPSLLGILWLIGVPIGVSKFAARLRDLPENLS
jgi:hypothetical protein